MTNNDLLADAAAAMDEIEVHLAADDGARARDVLNRVLPVLGKTVAAFEDPAGVSLYAGVTYVCVRLNRPERALQFAERALLEDAQDVVAHALLSESQKLYFAREFIRSGLLPPAVAILELLRESADSAIAAATLTLLTHFESERSRIRALPRRAAQAGRPRPILMNVVVWGEDYVRPFLQYGLPSLMATGNIPGCAQDRDVILDIYTSEEDRDVIVNSAAGKHAAGHATLQFNILPDALLNSGAKENYISADRWCTAGAQLCSALRAYRIGADLTFICSSGVFASNCFTSSAAYLDAGYGVVMNCTPRAYEPALYDRLAGYAEIEAGRIEAPAESLTAFIIDNLHPHCRNLFITDPPGRARQDPTTLYFKTASGYASRTFQPSPLLISHELLCDDFTFDYMTTDARFVAELLRGRDPEGIVKIAENPEDELVVVDVDCGDNAGMKEYGEIPVALDNAALCALGTAYRESDLQFYEWLLRQRFSVSGDSQALPVGNVDECKAVDELTAIIRRDRGPVLEKLRLHARYASNPASRNNPTPGLP